MLELESQYTSLNNRHQKIFKTIYSALVENNLLRNTGLW